MVTDRDLLLAAARERRPLDEIPVESAMSMGCYVVAPRDDIQAVERVMCRHQVRRVPVLHSTGAVIGIVTLGDLARHQAALPTGDPNPDRQVVAATLSAVVQPSLDSRTVERPT